MGTCAERVALGTAVVAGVRYGDIKAVAVATYTPDGRPASPCGMCRQFMREFCEPDMPVLLVDASAHVRTVTFGEVGSGEARTLIVALILYSFYRCLSDRSSYRSMARRRRVLLPFLNLAKAKPK